MAEAVGPSRVKHGADEAPVKRGEERAGEFRVCFGHSFSK